MKVHPLPFDSPLARYEAQARELLDAHRAADPDALDVIHHNHPRFLDETTPWLPRQMSSEEVAAAPFDAEDARLTVARAYSFLDWPALAEHVSESTRAGSPVHEFESGVNTVITGDTGALRHLLEGNPDLVRARSRRRTSHDPPVHAATLLHYVAANGVEGHNQKSPSNAVDVATMLLRAGADVDALAAMYGGNYTTMSMLVSSSPPAAAGVQVPLVETLLDFGAAIDGIGDPTWGSPLGTALVFEFTDVAELLVRRGARVDDVAHAAGLGRLADVERLLPASDAASRHRALALAAQLGHADVVRVLLDAGEDPDRYNPDGTHAHSTPLHQAALHGHDAVVRLLVERGARVDIQDKVWHGTPHGWATYAEQPATAAYLASVGGAPAGG